MATTTNRGTAETVRFYGVRGSLALWCAEVRRVAGADPGPVREKRDRYGVRHFAEVALSADQRQTLQDALWYAESGTGTTATGRPYRWNDCISYEVVRPRKTR